MGLFEALGVMPAEPIPNENRGNDYFFWGVIAVPAVRTAIVATVLCAPIVKASYDTSTIVDIDLLNTRNPDGTGACESFGGTIRNLGSLSLRSGSLVYNDVGVDSRVAGSIPPNTSYAWEVCEVKQPSGVVMYGVDADVLGALISTELTDKDGRAWVEGNLENTSAA
jgi:hypothetical protein